ncbi:hypothetical protein GW17_00002825 [Ensete ventricosum]|nr:hypothetical protein GW17_00002825 [Ensete ventricosum]
MSSCRGECRWTNHPLVYSSDRLLIDPLRGTDQASAEVRGDTGCHRDQERDAESERWSTGQRAAAMATPEESPAASSSTANAAKKGHAESGSTSAPPANAAKKDAFAATTEWAAAATGGGDDELGNVRFLVHAIHGHGHAHLGRLVHSPCHQARLGAVLSIRRMHALLLMICLSSPSRRLEPSQVGHRPRVRSLNCSCGTSQPSHEAHVWWPVPLGSSVSAETPFWEPRLPNGWRLTRLTWGPRELPITRVGTSDLG